MVEATSSGMDLESCTYWMDGISWASACFGKSANSAVPAILVPAKDAADAEAIDTATESSDASVDGIDAIDCDAQLLSKEGSVPDNGSMWRLIFLVAYLTVALYVAPIVAALYLPRIELVYFCSAASIALVNLWMFGETIAALVYTHRMRQPRPALADGPYELAAIVAAFLPNELNVLKESLQLMANLDLPESCTLTIVLAHNGGTKEQRVLLLELLQRVHVPDGVEIHELRVGTSTTKAENVNAALNFLEPRQVTHIAMFDADHRPATNAFVRALGTMQLQNADMVMGRCCVPDGFLVAMELDVLYAVSHAGGRQLRGFGFFGGSNGYWRAPVLQRLRMDPNMLTEDVDASFRAQAAGYFMTYDPTVLSYEEAPPTWKSLFRQRLRWSQGWTQVTLKQRYRGSGVWQGLCLFWLLPFREVYCYLSSFAVPIVLVWLFQSCGAHCTDEKLLALLGFSLVNPILATLAACYLTGRWRTSTLGFVVVNYLYEWVKVNIMVLGHGRMLLGCNEWVVTERHQPEKALEEQPAAERGRVLSHTFHGVSLGPFDLDDETDRDDDSAPFDLSETRI